MTYKQLTIEERYQIKAYLKTKVSIKDISIELGRHISTITREIKRNTGKKGYRPKQADEFALKRRKTALKSIKLTQEVKADVETLIRQELSPEQVCIYLERHRKVKLHHDTIYGFVAEDKANGGDLYTFMRHLHKTHQKRYGSYQKRGRIKNAVSIEERSDVIENKERIGDYEGDLIIGKDHKSAIYTLVERKTLYTIMIKLAGKNANGLIRQYFPKRTDFNEVSEEEILRVMDRLNSRPRKTRGGKQPIELFLGKAVDLLAA
ncbi:Mobile element protein [hydrothermal vent metagenome]|uniref:Mobile element protein n=1 Tax=hydrothermal vent metagenome TaxID=652676 RepID=A0A3B0WPV5_9ZZZZ